MKYRKIGRIDGEFSALGFGTMRLPTLGKDSEIDEPLAIAMIRRAIDNGVNYVDTAWPYHGGQSERLVGKALKDGYRRKVSVATKLPVWDVNSLDDCDRIFNEQLARLETDHVEFYLLHCLYKGVWPKMRDLGVVQWAERQQKAGRVGHIGFSFHDDFETFKEILDYRDWAFCQIQYNYVNEKTQAGTEGLEYAASKGVGVVVMEPLFGGTLANPPQEVQGVWDAAERNYDPIDMALRWLWNKPEVAVVLSGMSAMEHVQRNLASAERSGIGTLDQQDLEIIAKVQARYEDFSPIPCTKCGYCMPCPTGIDIPAMFALYNDAVVFKGNSMTLSRNLYAMTAEDKRASACVACKECQEKCPQHIEISEMMKKVHEELRPRQD